MENIIIQNAVEFLIKRREETRIDLETYEIEHEWKSKPEGFDQNQVFLKVL